jgi:hypothetical protein
MYELQRVLKIQLKCEFARALAEKNSRGNRTSQVGLIESVASRQDMGTACSRLVDQGGDDVSEIYLLDDIGISTFRIERTGIRPIHRIHSHRQK